MAHDRLVVAVRKGHALVDAELTLDRYIDADRITVSRRGRLRDRIEDLLRDRRLRRRVAAAVPTSTAVLHFVRYSDLLVAVPEHMTRPVTSELGLRRPHLSCHPPGMSPGGGGRGSAGGCPSNGP